MGKFQVKNAGNGQSFNLLATNGQIIASSQVYHSKRTLLGGIASVQKNCAAPVEDQTEEGFQKLANPKFEVYLDKAKKFRFRLKAKNGQIIAVGEAYESKKTCLAGIASIGKNAPDAPIVEA